MATRVACSISCECVFCTFLNKVTATSGFVHVLAPGGTGRAERSDAQGRLSWIACIADAQPLQSYVHYLTKAGLTIQRVEKHDEALFELVRAIQGKLLGAELLVKLNKITLPGEMDVGQAKMMAKAAATAIQARQFGYVVITAAKS